MNGKENNLQPKKRPSRSSKTTLILVLAVVILILVNIFIFTGLKSENMPRDNADLRENTGAEQQDPIPGSSGEQAPAVTNEYAGYTPIDISSDEVHFGELILVNNDTPFVSEGVHDVVAFETPVKVYDNKNKNYTVSYPAKILLNPTVIEQLNLLFTDYVAFSGEADVYINQAHRTIEEQQAMYDEKGPDIATKPGYSEHHSGYAFDVAVVSGGKYSAISDTGHYTWLPENCKKYGFIRRYPEGKKDITGINFEPWHYRYVGVPHSYYITENSLTLEEYTKLVKSYTFKGNHLKITCDGAEYEVYYVPAAEGTTQVYVPADKPYNISGNNVDGFVVTICPEIFAQETVSE